jgi:transposase
VVESELDGARLDGLHRIGVDEVSYYRKGHRYLMVVADHDRGGAVVWAAEGRDAKTLEAFYDELLRRARRGPLRNSRPCRWTWAVPTGPPPTPRPGVPASV